MSERDAVFSRLAQMWDRRDPMPDSLVDKVLVAIETESLDAEYELLHLVERSRQLEGIRGVGEASTIAFSGGAFSLLLRVTANTEESCRVDGWVSPPKAMTVNATQHSTSFQAAVDTLGRFTIDALPRGLTRFFLVSHNDGDPTDPSFATPTFEL